MQVKPGLGLNARSRCPTSAACCLDFQERSELTGAVVTDISIELLSGSACPPRPSSTATLGGRRCAGHIQHVLCRAQKLAIAQSRRFCVIGTAAGLHTAQCRLIWSGPAAHLSSGAVAIFGARGCVRRRCNVRSGRCRQRRQIAEPSLLNRCDDGTMRRGMGRLGVGSHRLMYRCATRQDFSPQRFWVHCRVDAAHHAVQPAGRRLAGTQP